VADAHVDDDLVRLLVKLTASDLLRNGDYWRVLELCEFCEFCIECRPVDFEVTREPHEQNPTARTQNPARVRW
jgi:hypothetical protein